MKLNELVKLSSEMQLLDIRYQGATLICSLYLNESDEEIEVQIRSKIFYINLPERMEEPFTTCHIELLELENELNHQNGVLIPSSEFKRIMDEKRKNLNLCYGSRIVDSKYLFSLVGTNQLFSCIIANENSLAATVVSHRHRAGN